MITLGIIVVWLFLQVYIGVKLYKKAVVDLVVQDVESLEGDPLVQFLGWFAIYKRSAIDLFIEGRLIAFLIFWPIIMPIFFVFGVILKVSQFQGKLLDEIKEEALKKKALENLQVEDDDFD